MLFPLLHSNAYSSEPAISSLVDVIAFSACHAGTWEIWILHPETGKVKKIGSGSDEKHNPAISPDHCSIAWSNNLGEIRVWKRGNVIQLRSLPEHCNFPAWNPDANKLVCACFSFVNGQEDSDFWVVEPWKDTAYKFFGQAGIQKYPRYSPDGKKLYYSLAFIGQGARVREDIWRVSVRGKRKKRLVTNGACNIQPFPSPCGRWIVYASDAGGNMDVWKARSDGSMQVQLTHDTGLDVQPCWSPDGRHIVFVSTRSGRYDLWVMNSDGSDQRILTDEMDGDSRDPFWGVMDQDVLQEH